LVNLTRAFLRQPRIWLLDEPTASMDRGLEQQVAQALKAAIGPADTLVLVTHKAEMFDLVDRLIVVANGSAKFFEGNYDAWESAQASVKSRQMEQASKSASAAKPNEPARPSTGQLPKKKRKYPFRKTSDLEVDIASAESDKASLEAQLADPSTYRDESKARQVREKFAALETKLTMLYEHWEEAMEYNS
jgi:ATPase subunit of ABC transporter with duplicated ATPase domains